LLADIKGGAKNALIKSLNATLDYSVELTQKSIGEATTLDAKLIKTQVTKEAATDATVATMRLFGGRVPLVYFRTAPMVIGYRLGIKGHGVKVQVFRNKPAVEFRHAFFARMPSGHEGLFERNIKKSKASTGRDEQGRLRKNRLPIDEMKGPSPATIYKKTPGMSQTIELLSADRLLLEMGQQTDKLLRLTHG
jgi:hypothetical protein